MVLTPAFREALRCTTMTDPNRNLIFLDRKYVCELWDDFAPTIWKQDGCSHHTAGYSNPWPAGLDTPQELATVIHHVALLERARPFVKAAEEAYKVAIGSGMTLQGKMQWARTVGDRTLPGAWASSWGSTHVPAFLPSSAIAKAHEAAFQAWYEKRRAKGSPTARVYPYAPLIELHGMGIDTCNLVRGQEVSHLGVVSSLVILHLPHLDLIRV